MLPPTTLRGKHGAYCILDFVPVGKRQLLVWATGPDFRYLSVLVPFGLSDADGIRDALDRTYERRRQAELTACSGPRPFSPDWHSTQE